MTDATNFSAALPAVGGAAVSANRPVLKSPTPPALIAFTPEEHACYEQLCAVLRDAGIEHLTAGIPLAVIVRTFSDWLAAVARCEKDGRTQTSKTGWATETPWAKDEARLKMELGQWLPKACLTIPSLARVRKDLGVQGGQDDLFADLVNHATSSRGNGLPN
jgi:hypothetical protein